MKEDNNINPVEPVTPVTPTESSIEPTPMQTPAVEQTVQPVQQPEPVVQQSASPSPMLEPQIDPSFGTNVSVPVQPVPEPTKKKSLFPVVFVLLVLSAACFGGAYYYFFMGDKKQEEKTTTAIKEPEEVTDAATLELLKKGVFIYQSESIDRIDSDLYKKDNYKVTNERIKMLITLYNTASNPDESLATKTYEVLQSDPEMSDLSQLEYELKDYDSVAKSYKKIYNEELTEEKILSVFENGVYSGASCPSLYYDKTTKMFIEIHMCGGDSGVEHLSYIYRNQKEERDGQEYYYTYVAVGRYEYGSQNPEDYDVTLYYGYTPNAGKEDISNLQEDSYKIDESNYNKFDKFKYVFIKDKTTGNIYVDHIEMVMEN